jgi:hypothetical protein
LEDFAESLERQITLLKNKQIRERKNTWLYKAEKARVRSSTPMPFDLQRSTARVSPAVNSGFIGDSPALVKNEQAVDESSLAGFVEDETGTSPRQSSLSSFHDFRRKISAQVYPMQPHLSTQDHGSVTSLKQSEESGV